ncbi:L-aspartate oxidase [Bacillus glycinifermentans]|uniref:L-aspartate oxidase n=1 Tax=Bacillus glycinifermentans TaxID=1664069 RepID=A0A0J6EUC5_9BACI|nr:L-aspartate oxidase [Bacillus glycinifermentans]ATH92633.1 L-aspartate oxidase [Bacillus glycinifermentans]KMM59856.1 L-aspartate oxidase [Bacillus glycinifermentans]KRT95379.1 L-aspartate oxidase [Bacillus glycinifermentans]MEC0486884.1 L-aspartate oxidase [Bacillus glycinifermentans]MEC0493142.1 L-aspartate oxidase [Bacillus glycinifermentans]
MSSQTIVVVGAGAAALSFAAAMPPSYEVIVITKSSVHDSNSMLAQGGIAASVQPQDSSAAHAEDTLYAGGGHNHIETVNDAVVDGRRIVMELISQSFPFDKDRNGRLQLGKEGAHSANRILHAGGDATGRMLVRHLISRLHSNVILREYEAACELWIDNGRCAGVWTKDQAGSVRLRKADYVVLAAGGCGNLFQMHTNNRSVTSDGLSLAYRAGACLTDLEFVQFHPTLLAKNGRACGLVSEAVRGEGAVLIDENGRRIMEGVHPLKDLAPRDIVARAIHDHQKQGSRVFLDISEIPDFYQRFPTVSTLCEQAGISIEKGRLPVSPGMHFLMGGISVNRWGETSVPHLYAIGEAACTGFHGANRLASNSLLECLVYGKRAAKRIQTATNRMSLSAKRPSLEEITFAVPECSLEDIRKNMTDHVSIIRTADELKKVKKWFEQMPVQIINVKEITNEALELAHLWQTATLMTDSALLRKESRGGHFRSDFPFRDDAGWKGKQIVHSKGSITIRQNEGIVNNAAAHA